MLTIDNKPFHIAKRARILFDQYNSENHKAMLDISLCIISLGSVLSFLGTKDAYPQQLQSNLKQNALKYYEKNNDESLATICRHMRNAIAHSHIVVNGSQEEIESVCFEDFNNDAEFKASNPNFSMAISVQSLKQFFCDLCQYIEKNRL